MIQYRDRVIDGERLDLSDPKEVYYLGHNLTVRSCEVDIGVSARALVIARTHFVDCAMVATKPLVGYRWNAAVLERCRFRGTFAGNQFGHRPDDIDFGAAIRQCDFSQAVLDGCDFYGCDPQTIVFPGWPCFTIFEPRRRADELRRVAWPGGAAMADDFTMFASATAAVTFYAPTVAAARNVDPRALRATLAALPGVRL